MKNGTMYASRLKKAITAARQSVGKVEAPDGDDPVRRLALSILGVHCSADEAERRVKQLLATMVDWNEVRVSTPIEISEACGMTSADGVEKTNKLIKALRAVYQRENQVSLERLKSMGRREARQYLEQLDGIDEFAVAAVVLWSLGGHAIPVDDRMLTMFQGAELVNPEATRAEVQAFFERHVPAAQAKEFCLLMQAYKPKAAAAKGKKGEKPAKKKATA